jgi:hypothetical protein
MFRAIQRHIIRRRFKKMTSSFDKRIQEARKKHAPVRHIVREKRAFVHASLGATR